MKWIKGDKTGKASAIKPRSKSERVCFTRPSRKERRVYSPSDLKRIYRYVVGSYGWKKATCALMEESGVQEGLEAMIEHADIESLCDQAPDLGEYSEYVPDGADELLDVPEGTIEEALKGCGKDVSLSRAIKGVALLLILVWGLWRRVSASRLWRFVLRRFVLLAILGEVLDRMAKTVELLLPAMIAMAEFSDELMGVCDAAENSQ